MARSYPCYGPAGTWKTSFALIDACVEEPVSYHELEAGGFRRATDRLELAEGSIYLRKHQRPFNGLEQIGTIIKTGQGNVMPQLSYDLDGWIEMFSGFANSYMEDIKAGRRPVVDTATRCWLMVRNYYNELVQKATGKSADNLGQLKFTAPNDIMLQLLEYPKAYDIDSVWIAHQDREFGSDPPKYYPDTMKEVPNNVDVSLQFKLVGTTGVATIQKGGEVGRLVGLEVPEPTLRKLNAILNVYPVLVKEGEEIERDSEVLLTAAKLRGLY